MTSDSLVESLEKLVLSPVSLRRIFTLFTRLHYSDPVHYQGRFEDLSNYVWSADPTRCTLFVDFDYNFQPKNTERLPAIFVGVSDVKYQKIVQDNRDTETEDRAGVIQIYRALTSVIVRHLSVTPDESLRLAELSAEFFMGIRPLLMERMHLGMFEVAQQVNTRPFMREATQPDQVFTSDIIMPLEYDVRWESVRESHRIKTVSFSDALAKYALPTSSQT